MKLPLRCVLLIILGYLLISCGGSGSGGGGDGPALPSEGNTLTPGVTLGANRGQALLGPIVGATVSVYDADNFNGTPLCTLTTSSLNASEGPGVMDLSTCSTAPGKLYFLVVRGGDDVDADDDGFLDSAPTPKIGALRALVSGDDIARGNFRINILTEIAYQSVTDTLLTGGTAAGIKDQLDNVAKQLLDADINSDEVIDNTDLISFSPLLDANAVSGNNRTLLERILGAIHSGNRSDLTNLSRQLLLASLGEIDFNGFIGPALNFVVVDIIVENEILYAAGFDADSSDNDLTILVLDIQDLESAALISEIRLTSLPADPRDVGIQMIKAGDYLYLVSRENGMVVVDVTDTVAPQAELHFEGSDFYAITAGDENILYVSSFDTGLDDNKIFLIDITNPSSPSIVASVEDQLVFSMAFEDGYLYTYGSGISTFDTGSPTGLTQLANFSIPTASGRNMVHHNGFLYVPISEDGIQGIAVFDVTDPEDIDQLDTISGFFGFVTNVTVDGNLLFAGNSFGSDGSTLTTFEIQGNGTLRLVDSRSAPSNYNLDSDGGRIYLSGSANLTAYPIAALRNHSRHFDFLFTPKDASHVEVVGDVAFVADGGDLLAIDVSTPGGGLMILDKISAGNTIRDMKIAGDYAYLASEGLRKIDISNPGDLQAAGSNLELNLIFDLGGEHIGTRVTETLAVAGAFVYTRTGGLLGKFSIAEPGDPILVGVNESVPHYKDLAVNGNNIYGVSGDVLDVYDADTIEFVNQIRLLAETIEVAGDYAYSSSSTSGISILNVGNTANPVLFGGRLSLGIGNAVSINDNTAYIANEFGMVEIYEVSSKTSPELLYIKKANGTVRDVFATEDYIYAVNGFGLIVEPVLKPFNLVE